jgi:AraC family transcriptional activator of pobA
MRNKTTAIPVNYFGEEFDSGILIEKIVSENLPGLEEFEQSERHHSHSFFLIEQGSVTLEIDFKMYKVCASSLIYMHPDQVHRILAFEGLTACMLLINNENLNPEYLTLLEEITLAIPLLLEEQTFSLISQAAALCMKLSKLHNNKLNHSLLKDSCNALVGLGISQYMARIKPQDKLSRYEMVSRIFKETLDNHYRFLKSPADYSEKLNISTPYLNECVRNATGHSVSHHIQQRVILEAKRLLYHSPNSVKQIAVELGYEDYHYFSRLFAKVAGMSALNFKNKNFD